MFIEETLMREEGEKIMEDLEGCCKIEMQTESFELRKCSSFMTYVCT